MKTKLIMGVAALLLAVVGYLLWSGATGDQTNYFKQAVGIKDKEPTDINLVDQVVTLEDGTEATLRVDSNFTVSVAASNLGKARFMAWSPDGRLFVPDLVNYNLSSEGRLFILEDWDDETGKFGTTTTYLTGLRGPNSVAFYTDEEGKDWLYIALTAHLVRYPYEAGDIEPSGEPEVVVEFPNQQSPGEVSVVWHITRTIFFEDDRLYVSVGSGCNSCEELAGDMRAMVYSMNPDGSDQRVEGEGLRNTVGIAMANGELYATGNGVDHLGTDAPDETLYKVENGQHYGWPYCYIDDGESLPDTAQEWNDPLDCADIPLPLTTFAPRSAPLGLRFFNNDSHPVLRNSFLVALHGSFDQTLSIGNEIRRITLDGKQQLFMDGFIHEGERIIRPVDFLIKDDNSFFFTDDQGGRVFYVRAK